MGLGDSTGRLTYLNIKKGKISYKNHQGEAKESDFIEGFITGVNFETKTYEGKEYEECKINIVDGSDKYQLQMKTDSGYFRGFCNAFRSGEAKLLTKITPTFKEEGAKKQSGCFVEQKGNTLKWYYSKANGNQDVVPKLVVHEVKKQKIYDGSDAIEFWKKWLLSLKFKDESEANEISSENQENGLNKKEDKPKVKKEEKEIHNENNPLDEIEDDDLPF